MPVKVSGLLRTNDVYIVRSAINCIKEKSTGTFLGRPMKFTDAINSIDNKSSSAYWDLFFEITLEKFPVTYDDKTGQVETEDKKIQRLLSQYGYCEIQNVEQIGSLNLDVNLDYKAIADATDKFRKPLPKVNVEVSLSKPIKPVKKLHKLRRFDFDD